MYGFPAVDGIPLPAPVWLFKLLHLALLALHLVLVQFVLGALLAAAVWEGTGRRHGDPTRRAGARQLARWLPTVMTFLINLGVPPLLFAQVLYGTSLYTSSTLIGVFWISVIGQLIVMYGLIYAGSFRAGDGRAWSAHAAAALVVGLFIAAIYSTNLTLMLRPDLWPAMYRESAAGLHLPFRETAVWSRWLFFLAGGLVVGGLGLVMVGANRRRPAPLRALLLRHGGLATVVGALAQGSLAKLILSVQQPGVTDAVLASPLYHTAAGLWLTLWAVTILVGLAAAVAGPRAATAGRSLRSLQVGAPAVAVLLTAAMTIVRDGLRDLTLRAAGFDVWAFEVAVNPGVLTIFLILVVLALAIVGGLIALAVKARPAEEPVTS